MAEVSTPMTEGTFDSEFFKEWESILNEDQPSTMSLRKKTKSNSRPPSRLVGESEEQRDRRLRLARECSLRRRSMETPEEREKRLHDQRTRMALKRKNESEEEREARRKKAREREKERRRSETGEKRELRLKYSRERASLRREKETAEDRQKRLEISRARAAERRKIKKLQDDSGEPSADPSSINASTSVSPVKPRAKKRSSRPRSVTRRKQKPEDDRQASPVIEYSMTDNGIPLEEYKVCRDYGSKQENKGGGGGSNNGNDAGGGGAPSNSNNANSNGFTDSMVGVVNDRQMISDVPDMAGHAQTSVTSLPSSLDGTAHHQSPMDGTDHGMTMILTPNPFHHSEASAFQPPPPPQAVVHPPQSMSGFTNLQGAGVIGGGVVKGGGGLVGGAAAGMVGNAPGGRVGDDILEGMGYLEHRFQLHPDFTLREQQNRSYNIQAVVLRNS